MIRIITIAICLITLASCAGMSTKPTTLHPTDNRVIINTGIYAKHGYIVMFDDDGDRTPDYFEYYNCHPLWGNGENLTIKQSDGSYRFGNHSCVKRGFADFRPKNQ